jgi:hypothetical protein
MVVREQYVEREEYTRENIHGSIFVCIMIKDDVNIKLCDIDVHILQLTYHTKHLGVFSEIYFHSKRCLFD